MLSLAEICGYLLAAASFLALAGTLKAGAHIRVTMALAASAIASAAIAEIWAFGARRAALALHGLAARQLRLGVVPASTRCRPASSASRSAYPQAAMALGAAILTIALIDELVAVLRSGRPSFRAAEDAVTLGKEG